MATHDHTPGPLLEDGTCMDCDWCPMCEGITEWTDDEHCRSCGYEWGSA